MVQLTKDVLFPIFCFDCQKEGEWLCKSCFQKFDNTGVWACPACGKENGSGFVCGNTKCPANSFLAGHLAVLDYDEKSVFAALLQAYKYELATEIEDVLRQLVLNFFSSGVNSESRQKFFFGVDLVVPVPLHPRRFAERGFNQSEKIAKIIAGLLGAPLQPVLRRSRFTKPQAKLKKDERKINIAGAFAEETGVTGKKILLVDDVFTTGATLEECARVLRATGAVEVRGFSLARVV